MNWADYLILGILGLSVLMGLWRGFISEVLALGVWVAAVWLAWAFGDDVATLFGASVSLPSARLMLGYAVCFIGVLLLGALLRFVMNKLVQGTGLGGSDRLLGMVFGLARGVLLVVVLVVLLGFTPFPRDPWWQASRLLPAFQRAAVTLGGWLPEDIAGWLDFDPAQLPAEAVRKLLPAAAATATLPAPATSAGSMPSASQD